jgi:hypothetical protein
MEGSRARDQIERKVALIRSGSGSIGLATAKIPVPMPLLTLFQRSRACRADRGVARCNVIHQPKVGAVKEYLATLDDTAWGAASDVVPKFVSPSDSAALWTGAHKGPAFFAYSDNYLIDVKFGVILDVAASRAIRQADVGAAKTMIERTEERFGLKPARLAGDTAYGAASMLNWLVEEKDIAPHIPVFDRSKRDDGTFSRSDFRYDSTNDVYHCLAARISTATRSGRYWRAGRCWSRSSAISRTMFAAFSRTSV